MRDEHDEIKGLGAEVVAIGMGRPDMAADFAEKSDIPFLLLVDHDRQTYRALEIKRGSPWDVLGPAVWIRGIKGIVQGHGAAPAKQDVMQMGGTAIVEQGGTIRYLHRSDGASDNLPVAEIMEQLR